jgi:hypothetical protein
MAAKRPGGSISKIKNCHKLYSFSGEQIISGYVIIDCKFLGIPEEEKIVGPVIALSLQINKPVPRFIRPVVVNNASYFVNSNRIIYCK